MTDRTDAELRAQLRAAVTALTRSETELAALREVARGYCPACGRGDAAPTVADWEQQRQRADQAAARVADYEQRLTWHTTCAACARVLETGIRETDRANRAVAQLDQVAALRDDLAGITGARWIATALDHILNPDPGPAATQATSPHTGLVIEPYRNDRSQNVWVFRCWGTDTCDGWLSLDHSSQQSAERARDRHVAEEHTELDQLAAALREVLALFTPARINGSIAFYQATAHPIASDDYTRWHAALTTHTAPPADLVGLIGDTTTLEDQ